KQPELSQRGGNKRTAGGNGAPRHARLHRRPEIVLFMRPHEIETPERLENLRGVRPHREPRLSADPHVVHPSPWREQGADHPPPAPRHDATPQAPPRASERTERPGRRSVAITCARSRIRKEPCACRSGRPSRGA